MSSSRHVLYTKDDTEELGEDNGIPLSNLQSDDCPLTDDSDVEEVTVTREPNQKSLGFSVISEVGELKVGRVIVDSPCHDQLRVGDRLLAVNDLQVAGLSPEELFSRLNQEQAPELTFKVRRASVNGNAAPSIEVEHLRAPYDYDASKDCQCPCKSAGLAFKQGDIIRVLNKSDRNWWQGRVLQADGSMGPAGIFPAPKFQRKHLKSDMAVDFESVTLQDSGHRPNLLILVGPPRGGRHELQAALCQKRPDLFALPECHTSRLRRPEEAEAAGFCFISKKEFKRFRKAGEFVEQWKAEDGSCGIHIESVKRVMDSGRVCVLALRPDSLEALRSRRPPLMPFTVFVLPPQQPQQLRDILGQLEDNEELTTDHSFVSRLSSVIKFDMGHLCDLFLQLTDLSSAVQQLVEQLEKLSTQRQWVPSAWLEDSTR